MEFPSAARRARVRLICRTGEFLCLGACLVLFVLAARSDSKETSFDLVSSGICILTYGGDFSNERTKYDRKVVEISGRELLIFENDAARPPRAIPAAEIVRILESRHRLTLYSKSGDTHEVSLHVLPKSERSEVIALIRSLATQSLHR